MSAGNVLGAETRRPILKWEEIIRKALNKSPEQVSIHKSYSAPTSPISTNNVDLGTTKIITVPKTKVINILNWPEKALDIKPKVLSSRTKLRRVLSSSARVSSDWLAPQDFGGGLKRVHHSSGDLGLLWTEQQERNDMVDSLDSASEQVLEDEDDFFDDSTEMKLEKLPLDDQVYSNHRYQHCLFLFFCTVLELWHI